MDGAIPHVVTLVLVSAKRKHGHTLRCPAGRYEAPWSATDGEKARALGIERLPVLSLLPLLIPSSEGSAFCA